MTLARIFCTPVNVDGDKEILTAKWHVKVGWLRRTHIKTLNRKHECQKEINGKRKFVRGVPREAIEDVEYRPLSIGDSSIKYVQNDRFFAIRRYSIAV